MVDSHYYPQDWGIYPTIFYIGKIGIPSYSLFVLLGLLVGVFIYLVETRRKKILNENGFFIAFGSLVGGILGAKILEWILNYRYFISNVFNPSIFFSGRTIIGGLIGGTIGAILTKKILGIKEKRGNFFAPAIAAGVAIGRIGCFLRGCCHGKETSLPWGINFGDGISRHPTQIYESLFMLAMFFYLEKIKNKKNIEPGDLFKILMVSYFIFRFFVEFIRVEDVVFVRLTAFQIIAVGVIIYLTKDNIINLIYKLKLYGRSKQSECQN